MSAEAEAGLPVTELDLRGEICPGPTGETLEALKTIPRWPAYPFWWPQAQGPQR